MDLYFRRHQLSIVELPVLERIKEEREKAHRLSFPFLLRLIHNAHPTICQRSSSQQQDAYFGID